MNVVLLNSKEHDLNMIDALFLSKVILSLNKIKNSKTFWPKYEYCIINYYKHNVKKKPWF